MQVEIAVLPKGGSIEDRPRSGNWVLAKNVMWAVGTAIYWCLGFMFVFLVGFFSILAGFFKANKSRK